MQGVSSGGAAPGRLHIAREKVNTPLGQLNIAARLLPVWDYQ